LIDEIRPGLTREDCGLPPSESMVKYLQKQQRIKTDKRQGYINLAIMWSKIAGIVVAIILLMCFVDWMIVSPVEDTWHDQGPAGNFRFVLQLQEMGSWASIQVDNRTFLVKSGMHGVEQNSKLNLFIRERLMDNGTVVETEFLCIESSGKCVEVVP